MTLDAVDKKGYEFIVYSKDDKFIPEDVHECMNEVPCLAMTFKDRKKVYFKVELLEEDKKRELLEAITNEALHIVLDPTDTVEEASEVFGRDTNSEEVKDETRLFKEGEETDSEKIFHDVLNEEVLSQVVEDIVLKKLENKNYTLTEDDLRDGKYSTRVLQIKSELSIPVFARVFDLEQFEEKDYPFILGKVNGYTASGKIEDYLVEKLNEFELLN